MMLQPGKVFNITQEMHQCFFTSLLNALTSDNILHLLPE